MRPSAPIPSLSSCPDSSPLAEHARRIYLARLWDKNDAVTMENMCDMPPLLHTVLLVR